MLMRHVTNSALRLAELKHELVQRAMVEYWIEFDTHENGWPKCSMIPFTVVIYPSFPFSLYID